MRKLCVLLVSVALVLGVALTPVAAAPNPASSAKGKQLETYLELFLGKKTANSSGKEFHLPEAPIVQGKHSLAPVRSIVSKLGGKVDFDKKAKQLTLTFGKTEVVMTVGKTVCSVNGKLSYLPTAPEQKGNNGTVFVPVRWLAELLGARVDFLPNGKIKISGKWQHEKPVEPPAPVKPTQIAFQVLPYATLRPDLLQTNPERPLLWHGPSANLLEQPSFALRDKNVLIVARGWQGSTGYGIEVQSLEVSDNELVARVRLIDPRPGSAQDDVMQYVYQALTLPDKLPEIDSWRIETIDGKLLNAQQLAADIPYQVADGADVNWADLEVPGVEAKPVTINDQDKLLIVVKRGAVPTTGYGIEVQALSLHGWGSLTVQVSHSDPAPGSFQAQVIRYPYQAVYVDPIYIGHEIDVVLLNKAWDQLVTVPRVLKNTIDRSTRGVIVGYGRDLLQNPGVWSDKLLLVAMRGYCPTGGYSITVDSLLRYDDDLVLVRVTDQDPDPDDMVTMAITYPYHVVELPAELAQYKFLLLEQ